MTWSWGDNNPEGIISHRALQRGSWPTLSIPFPSIPASLSLGFQEAHRATVVPDFWDVKKLLLSRACAGQNTHGLRKMGVKKPWEFTAPAASQERLLVFWGQQLFAFSPASLGDMGPSHGPGEQSNGGQGGCKRERRCLTHHLFSEQCLRGFLINCTPRWSKWANVLCFYF